MSAAKLMLDASPYNVTFCLNKNGRITMYASALIWGDKEVMALIRSQEAAIREQLERGFDYVRDGLMVEEVRTLLEASQRGYAVSLVRHAV